MVSPVSPVDHVTVPEILTLLAVRVAVAVPLAVPSHAMLKVGILLDIDRKEASFPLARTFAGDVHSPVSIVSDTPLPTAVAMMAQQGFDPAGMSIVQLPAPETLIVWNE